MKPAGWKEIVVLLICISIPYFYANGFNRAAHGRIRAIDFGEIYYGARCVLRRHDPYDPNTVLREFLADGGMFLPDTDSTSLDRIVVTYIVNVPTSLFLAVPISLMPWRLAQNLWMVLTAAVLVIAAFLTWDLGAGTSPLIWVALAGFMLAESNFLPGNVAYIAVSLCIIAVWCFLKERFVWAGVLMLALSLVLKPHDSGFVWLYFVLAGGALRKRALQTFIVAAVIAGCAALWITPASPHWLAELHRNLDFELGSGSVDDPGPTGFYSQGTAEIIDLQTEFSVFKNDPHFYNAASYLICGFLILLWGVKVLRQRNTVESTSFALAPIAALSLLPIYHRPYDAMLILLVLPACTMLWKQPGIKRWFALGLTSAAILLTATTPLAFLAVHTRQLAAFAARFPGRLPTVLLLRPTPFAILAMGCFYLWIFLRFTPRDESMTIENSPAEPIAAHVP